MTHEQNLGGAAYVCELSIGDEVLSMNGMTVAILSQDQIVEAGFLFFLPSSDTLTLSANQKEAFKMKTFPS